MTKEAEIQPRVAMLDLTQRIKYLSKKISQVQNDAAREVQTADDVMEISQLESRAATLKEERTKLAVQLLAEQQALDAKAIILVSRKAKEARAAYGELKTALTNYAARFDEAMASLGEEFQAIRELSEEMVRANAFTERTRTPVCGYVHLIQPDALSRMAQYGFSRRFGINPPPYELEPPSLSDEVTTAFSVATLRQSN